MLDQLQTALAAAPFAWFGDLDKTKQALVVIAVVFLAGAGLGAGGVRTVSEFAGHEVRIQSLEGWRDMHEDSVTAPRMRQIDAMQRTQDGNLQRLMRIETLLSCIYYEIERCPDPAPNPPPSGR